MPSGARAISCANTIKARLSASWSGGREGRRHSSSVDVIDRGSGGPPANGGSATLDTDPSLSLLCSSGAQKRATATRARPVRKEIIFPAGKGVSSLLPSSPKRARPQAARYLRP
jgi:hypothetical protein